MLSNPRHTVAVITGALVTLLAACAATGPKAENTAPAIEKIQYPPAARGTVVDDYHGTKIADPYRWFEDPNAQATKDWVAAENALALR